MVYFKNRPICLVMLTNNMIKFNNIHFKISIDFKKLKFLPFIRTPEYLNRTGSCSYSLILLVYYEEQVNDSKVL